MSDDKKTLSGYIVPETLLTGDLTRWLVTLDRPIDSWSPDAGDFNGDDVLDLADVEVLTDLIQPGFFESPGRWRYEIFDVDLNGTVDLADLDRWVIALAQTWYGDANLDGEFNTTDLISVFSTNKFETGETALWEEGDWNGDVTRVFGEYSY